MGRRRRRRWSLAAAAAVASNPLVTIRGRLGLRRKGVEGLCVSSLQGALRWHTWLTEEEEKEEDTALLQHQRAHFLSVCVRPADGEDLDPALPALDLQLSHISQGRRSFTSFSCSSG